MGGGASKVEVYEMRRYEADGTPGTKLIKVDNPFLNRSTTTVLSSVPSNSKLQSQPSLKKMQSGLGASSNNLNASPPTPADDGIKTRSNSMLAIRTISGLKTRSPSVDLSNQGIRVSTKVNWLVKDTKFVSRGGTAGLQFTNKVLGRGLMGTVRLAQLTESPGLYVAVKSIRKDYIIKHNDFRHVQSEKAVLSEINSHFCIKLFGTCQDEDNIYYVMEYAAGGELFRRLSRKQTFSITMTQFYAAEIFLAVNHIQTLGYVYRDLKPENVMLDEFGHCKLVDFGFTIRPNSNGKCLTNCGTPAYLSPEQLDGKFTGGYTKIVDWWSFGVLIYELLTGLTPFCNNNRQSPYEIYMRVLKGKINFPRKMAPVAQVIISSLLKADVTARLVDPNLIQKHEFFGDIDWPAIEGRKIIPPFVPKIRDEGDCTHFEDWGEFRDEKVNLKGKNPSKYDQEFIDF